MSRPTPAALPAQSRRTRRATEGAGQSRSVALVTLGCARNEVDSEELAGRLADGGWTLVEDPRAADVAVVNTCGFVESAKKDSIDALLEAAEYKQSGHTKAVVAVGCLAQRYGEQLAAELPEADAVLGFDSYASMSAQLAAILDGERRPSHTPSDRRGMLPLSPASRPGSPGAVPGHGTGQHPDEATRYPASGPRFIRARLADRPWAPLKIASGCDRRCAFCAIPMFRGAFVSRRPAEVVEEAYWLAERGVRELFLVSENSTSYGKDLGDLRLLERLLPELATVPGIERVRVSYLQPAELRPGLLEVIAGTPGVAPYFDLSFQHASAPLLRRMRRFGGREPFLELLSRVRASAPHAGVRSNLILGFPGETQADVDELETFLVEARLDAVGVFGYSDEDGTEAEGYPDKIEQDVVADRVAYIGDLVEQLTSQRAQQRVGEPVQVLVEEIEDGQVVGRAAHQGPDVDGVTLLRMPSGVSPPDVGRIVPAVVLDHDGVDLVAQPR